MRYLLSVYLGLVLGAAIGAAAGLGLELALGQQGWDIVLAALGACAAALWAGLLAADGRLIWAPRAAHPTPTPSSSDPSAEEPS